MVPSMHEHMTQALDTLRGGFGAVDRAQLQREHPGRGDMLVMGLLSHGYARATKDDRVVLTDAGWKAARANEA